MKKTLMLTIIIVIYTMSSLFVNAAAGYIDDFSEPPLDGKVENYPNWKYYSAATKEGVSWENGMIKFEKSSTKSLIWDIYSNLNTPTGFTLMDIKLNKIASNSGIGLYYVVNSARASYTKAFSGFEPDLWYKVLMLSTIDEMGNQYFSLFAKPENSNTWVKQTGPISMTSYSEQSLLRFNWNTSATGHVMYIDNIESHEGIYYEDITVSNQNNINITNDMPIPSDTTQLKISANVYNAKDINENFESANLPSVFPVVVAYDNNGMVVGCSTSTQQLNYFRNTFTLSMDLGTAKPSEISTMKFYLWNNIYGMRNILPPVTLR